jgi:hypothetical protein
MMRFIKLLLLFLVSTGIAHAYEFKGYSLGMPLSNFKDKGIHPDLSSGDNTKLVCSDEFNNENLEFGGAAPFGISYEYSKYASEQIVVCSFFDSTNIFNVPSYFQIKINGNEAGLETIFVFVKTNTNKEPELARINIYLSPNSFNFLSKEFAKKYGVPSSQSKTLQNGFGTKFNDQTLSWSKNGEEINYWKYVGRTDQSAIEFNGKLSKILDKLELAKQKKETKGL